MTVKTAPKPAAAERIIVVPSAIEAANLWFRRGDRPVLRDVSVRVEAGATLALLGPSGCGKTTLLRVLAGLERPEAGYVTAGERVLTAPDRFVAPERRSIGMVFQDGALFPHLTVTDNVAFGVSKAARRAGRVEEALALVGLEALGHRLPAQLSGGERQRVAVARAIAPEPAVLLLDEPFASLDAALRVELRTEVRRLLRELGITSIFVTHDQEEAFVIGDEVAVMREGQVLQQARPRELYERPADRWVARFVGEANLVAGRARGGVADTPFGSATLAHAAEIEVIEAAGGESDAVEVLMRPEYLVLAAGGDWRIETVEYYGHDSMYVLRGADGSSLHIREGSAPSFAFGDVVSVRYDGPPTVAFDVGAVAAGSPASVLEPAAN